METPELVFKIVRLCPLRRPDSVTVCVLAAALAGPVAASMLSRPDCQGRVACGKGYEGPVGALKKTIHNPDHTLRDERRTIMITDAKINDNQTSRSKRKQLDNLAVTSHSP